MATANVNHEGYHRRLRVVQSIIHSYGLQSVSVTPVEYVEHIPFQYNNYIYKVELSQPATTANFANKTQRPGTSVPPESGVSVLILRLSNPRAEDLNNANRVENEVAAQSLFRQQLSASYPALTHLLPAVYAWEPCRWPLVPDEAGFAWTMNEFMPGANLDEQFREMQLAEKLAVVEQVADIFAALQNTPLPSSLKTHIGGLTFDGATAQVVGAQMPLTPAGPWDKYEEMWVSQLQKQLDDADGSWALKGWKEAGLRDRIDKLLDAARIAHLLEGVDLSQRVLVHADLTMNNMLFDKESKRVTALLDFDFSRVTHPVHEYFTGLWDLGGGWVHSNDEKLHRAVVTGNFEARDEATSPEDKVVWEVAKAWNSALNARGVLRPSQIGGIEKLERLRQFEEALAPFHLSSTVRLERQKRKTPQETDELIKEATDRLESLLVELGA
ncbi:hypothetical protein BKA67DRAFT_131810 [Truncatella angustata]|uniref:Aminoglycoside phosphotransferase domain-containing protein n=1 Tax=Truncatella angustata TaxID=152316 RepID=A0A9P8UBL6_9PEZI|nr:uncharacterized protein BKA67DRAFT_131810 [Truncatella angustata]KAH6643261.1 hypothetical protein BKA67DRAFT_131810 [Truncatella angustata]KAH8199021.1 hypothetical protein TruAng_006807 [Truncatella angustata]